MARSHDTGFDIGHPAPDRGRVRNLLLLAGLAGAPLAWSGQLAVLSALGSVACAAGDGPATPVLGLAWAPFAAIAVNLAALAIGAAALALSVRNVNRTRRLQGAGGIVDAGEGRTRFLAIWGILAGILFILAIGFNTISVFWVGLCEG